LPQAQAADGSTSSWNAGTTPGLGVELNEEATRQYLPEGAEDFFE